MLNPCTTFAGGINPFQGLGALPSTQAKHIMSIPAKPARKNAKRVAKDEDYSTPWQPPKVVGVQHHVDMVDFVICNDPLPKGRPLVKGGKYDDLFQQLGRGQAIKCPPGSVAAVQHSLRKWIRVQRVPNVMVKTCKNYGDGLGRVWLLAAPGAAAPKA